jgi:hypothetical protein
MKIRKSTGRVALGSLWFLGGGFLFILFVVQTILGRYEGKTDVAWAWLLPTIMPTLLLMIGVFAADAMGPQDEDAAVKPFIFFLSFGISVLYLAAVALTILLQPYSKTPFWELMKQSNLYLGPFQGLVAAAIGIFFVKAKELTTQIQPVVQQVNTVV